jgi:Bacterial archaeo-eukaryotic release factor family 2
VELDRLRPVFEESGPFLTVHVDVSRTDEHGAEQIESRWTTISHDLDRAELPADLVAQLDAAVHENTHLPGEVRRTIVAAGGRIVLDEVQLGHNPHPEVVDLAELPDLAGWLDVEDQAYPFVLAVVDRAGGEVETYRATSQPSVGQETVEGTTVDIRKLPVGGWAQDHYQQTAEDRWHENAELVAEAVRAASLTHGCRAAFVAGEVRARSEVVKAIEGLDRAPASVVEIESGGLAEGASREAMWEEVHERLRELVAEADSDVSARLDEGRGRGEGVATGLDDVLGALVRGQVEELAVDLGAMSELTVEPAKHEGLPLPAAAASAHELPADRVLVAAAALTGARLRVLPATMAHGGGVSAVLRWDDSTSRG